MVGSGRVEVGLAPLDPSLDVSSAVAELDQRIRDLETRELETRSATDARIRLTDRALSEVGADVERVESRVDKVEDELRVEGLRTEAVGLGLVGAGLILQGAAAVFAWLP
jgi:hypothetical protein